MECTIRSATLGGLLGVLTLATSAAAAIPASAPPSDVETAVAPSSVVCKELGNLDRPLTPDQLKAAHLCQEVAKLELEVAAIRKSNDAPFGAWLPWTGIITGMISGAIALLVGLLGILFRRSYDKTQSAKLVQESLKLQQERLKVDQDRMLQRDAHNLGLMQGLGAPNRAIQLASVSSLLRRVQEIGAELEGTANDARTALEFKTLADVVVSVLRDPAIDDAVAKYLGDELVNVCGMRGASGTTGRTGKGALRLLDFNMQQTKLREVYWTNVTVGEVDFYRADFTRATLRNAKLERTIFYKAILRDTVLVDANLTGANLQGADLRGARLAGANFTDANLDGVIFDHTTHWDERTRWPKGYVPQIDVATS